MLARLFVPLSFDIAIPKTALFRTYNYESSGYSVQELPPSYLDDRNRDSDPATITINGESAVLPNILRIDFWKDSFDRQRGVGCDPPQSVLTAAVNSFLLRLRHVVNAHQVRGPELSMREWRLEYTNDDGTPLEPTTGFAVAHGSSPLLSVSFVCLTPEIWSRMHELPVNYEPLPWEVPILDATGELPDVGTAIVLGATALEVFIGRILQPLATARGVPEMLWS